MRLGIDVGGTNTDAVVINGNEILSANKQPTTQKPSDGIIKVIENVLSQANVKSSALQTVMLGTTHFTNAFVQRRNLDAVGIMRLGLPAARGLPPMVDWPEEVVKIVSGDIALIRGGHEYNGKAITKLDEIAIMNAAKQFKAKGLKSVAITGIFSPVVSDGEKRAADIIYNEIPDIAITLSSEIGKLGLIERENATIMNASLHSLASETISSFETAFASLGINVPFYISQNDGTLMSAERARSFPILTFSSGPTNSIRGASFLSGLKNAMVADIGGTTTDIGVLKDGFPRESTLVSDIGSIRTNFRMPDVIALGLGGGSLIAQNNKGLIDVGPRSVGYRLLSDAMVFGGKQITTTDIAVAAGYADIGDKNLVAGLNKTLVENSVKRIHQMLEDGIDRMKVDANPEPLILVGGGSVLINQELEGISEVHMPKYADTANAVGASIAMVGVEIERITPMSAGEQESIINSLKKEIIEKAIKAGGEQSSVELTDIEVIPLPYVPGGVARIRLKAVADLQIGRGV